ncbi:MAG: hypothetical protein OXI22_12950 [Defluviicoccus sp.]|nr:hypothetical protein [Defluviicoccus sp.]MDE0384789.1 hypothetical protein [Defluviicoccus sp.]
MVVASAPPPLNGDAIQSIGRVLPWLARVPDQPDGSEFALGNPAPTSEREAGEAAAALEGKLRKRHESLSAAFSAMTGKLRTEIQSAARDTVIDPDGAGVQALEEAEAYFRSERRGLRDVRRALEESRLPSTHGPRVFDELDRLDRLFFGIVQWCQEIRWLVMTHDGVASPTTGKTFTSGAELVSSLTTQ